MPFYNESNTYLNLTKVVVFLLFLFELNAKMSRAVRQGTEKTALLMTIMA
jgi:hypothetical protein